jgi:pimeloyl-ACP methyl ester carboxylesterase
MPCVDGIKLHWSSTGQGPQTVILVHGWTCDDTTWKSQVPVLAKNYRVLTLDLPGHGKSDAPMDRKLSIDLFARAVESVRREAGADRVVLVGHSMGTPVIVQYARLYPRHVSAMVFVDGIATTPSLGPVAWLPGLTVRFRVARRAMIRGMFSSATMPDMRKHILTMMLGTPKATAVGAMNATFDPSIRKDDVLTQPILGLYAEKSAHANREYMKTHFPNLQYVEVAGTSHFLMLEKPDEFNLLLLGFLSKQTF